MANSDCREDVCTDATYHFIYNASHISGASSTRCKRPANKSQNVWMPTTHRRRQSKGQRVLHFKPSDPARSFFFCVSDFLLPHLSSCSHTTSYLRVSSSCGSS